MAKEKMGAGDRIAPASGKLGIMIPGMGAVATTFVAGVEAVRRGHAKPIGSLTQMGTVRLGKRTEGRTPKVSEFVPLAVLGCIGAAGIAWRSRRAAVIRDASIDVHVAQETAPVRGHRRDQAEAG